MANRIGHRIGTATYPYDKQPGSNRLAVIQNLTNAYAFDNAGNALSDGTLTFTYNDAGRLAGVVKGADTLATYRYNAFGQRVSKITATATRHFVYDEGGLLLGEYDGGGAVIQEYVWINGLPAMILTDKAKYYVHPDHLGTPRAVYNKAGAIVWRWDSDPFGATPAVASKLTVNLRFPGQYFDEESGLHYNYFREYEPATGRYTSCDPIGLEGGMNRYGYVRGNPISFIDPFGLFEITVNGPGGRNGATYGGTITVTGNNGQTITVPASSWPNPSNPSPGVQPGSYTGTYSPTGHQGATNGVRVNNGGQVPTMGPNPAQGGQSNATGINIHCGNSATNRGSAGCITVSPSSCQQVWSVLQPGETGTVQVNR